MKFLKYLKKEVVTWFSMRQPSSKWQSKLNYCRSRLQIMNQSQYYNGSWKRSSYLIFMSGKLYDLGVSVREALVLWKGRSWLLVLYAFTILPEETCKTWTMLRKCLICRYYCCSGYNPCRRLLYKELVKQYLSYIFRR